MIGPSSELQHQFTGSHASYCDDWVDLYVTEYPPLASLPLPVSDVIFLNKLVSCFY